VNKWILLVLAALVVALLLLGLGRPKPEAPEQVAPTPTPAPRTERRAEPVAEEGAFRMLYAGSPVGEERYSLRSVEGEWELRSEVDLSIFGQEATLRTNLQLAAPDLPQTYSLQADTPQERQELRVTLDWTAGKASLQAKAGRRTVQRELSVERPLFVIDNNVSSHFVVLYRALRVHDWGARPELKGMALAPQPMLTVPLRAEPPQSASVVNRATGETVDVQSFRVQLGDLAITVYGQGDTLLVIDNPAQQVLVYRSDLLPEGVELSAPSSEAEASESALPRGVREVELSFRSEGLTLAGTLALPQGEGPFPAVLLLPGSGPVDRDENAPGLPIDFFREAAHRLAREGIASFRYDKRGVGESEGDLSRAGMRDLVRDARAALEFLRSREEVDPRRVFVLGHSEGGVLAPLLASEGGVAGVILVAAPAQPLDRVLLEQARRIAEAMGLPPEQVEAQVRQTRRFIELVKSTEGDWEDLPPEELQERFPLAHRGAARGVSGPLSEVVPRALSAQPPAGRAVRAGPRADPPRREGFAGRALPRGAPGRGPARGRKPGRHGEDPPRPQPPPAPPPGGTQRRLSASGRARGRARPAPHRRLGEGAPRGLSAP